MLYMSDSAEETLFHTFQRDQHHFSVLITGRLTRAFLQVCTLLVICGTVRKSPSAALYNEAKIVFLHRLLICVHVLLYCLTCNYLYVTWNCKLVKMR